jgi:hypothetical protein
MMQDRSHTPWSATRLLGPMFLSGIGYAETMMSRYRDIESILATLNPTA